MTGKARLAWQAMSRKWKGGGKGSGGTQASKMSAFFAAVRNEKLPTVRWSLSNIGSLHGGSRDEEGRTSMMVASEANSPRALDMIIAFYARAAALREDVSTSICS